MSNRLYAKDRIDIVPEVEGSDPFDQHRIIRLADIGVTRQQIPGFVANEIAAAREIASRTRHLREPAHAA